MREPEHDTSRELNTAAEAADFEQGEMDDHLGANVANPIRTVENRPLLTA